MIYLFRVSMFVSFWCALLLLVFVCLLFSLKALLSVVQLLAWVLLLSAWLRKPIDSLRAVTIIRPPPLTPSYSPVFTPPTHTFAQLILSTIITIMGTTLSWKQGSPSPLSLSPSLILTLGLSLPRVLTSHSFPPSFAHMPFISVILLPSLTSAHFSQSFSLPPFSSSSCLPLSICGPVIIIPGQILAWLPLPWWLSWF